MSKHTPGPWRNVIGYDGSNTVIAGKDNNLECVALIKSRPSCQADAYLIAAAPDLFRIVQEIAYAMHEHWTEPMKWTRPLLDNSAAILATITKGEYWEGKQP